jgi:hypothetical protein
VRHSHILTGNDLAKLAGSQNLPDLDAIRNSWQVRLKEAPLVSSDMLDVELRVGSPDRALDIVASRIRDGKTALEMEETLHKIAALYLRNENLEHAWECLLAAEAG